MSDIESFKNDLRVVLEKHKALIWADVDGDTHGVESSLCVEIDGKDFSLSPKYESWVDAKNI